MVMEISTRVAIEIEATLVPASKMQPGFLVVFQGRKVVREKGPGKNGGPSDAPAL